MEHSKSFNEKKDIWDQLNNEKGSNNNLWVPATSVANYLLNDPALDWYKKMETKPINNCIKTLFEFGNEFEHVVIKKLIENFGSDVLLLQGRLTNFTDTVNAIKLGVPIIYNAKLINNSNFTYGVPDLIIRSDWINKIVRKKVLNKKQEKISAPGTKGKYHYVIIDIKWSMLNLCADGMKIQNSGRYPAYKGQLAIYNAALGNLQGYIPQRAYILGKAYQYTTKGKKVTGENCFDLLGHIIFDGFDNGTLEKTVKAIKWIRKLHAEKNLKVLPKPTTPELYPNMSSVSKERYKEKFNDAIKLHELTLLWNVGYKNRVIGHKNNIYKYTDNNCTAESLGIKKKRALVLNKIIKTNKNKNKDGIIKPKVIKNNIGRWKNKEGYEFFVDIETLNTQFTKKVKVNGHGIITNFIFMIGLGYISEGEYKYKCIYANGVNASDEKKLLLEFKKFLVSYGKPKLFHYTKTEPMVIKSSCLRNDVNNFTTGLWSDFYNVLSKEPVTFKGVLSGFNLKTIVGQMRANKQIDLKWDNNISNGFQAMIKGCEYYKTNNKKILNEIIMYNNTDCKALALIIEYFRKNHK